MPFKGWRFRVFLLRRVFFLRLFGRVWRRRNLALVGFVAAVGGKPFPVLAVNLHHRVQIRKLATLPGG